jgi:hypothetical protein
VWRALRVSDGLRYRARGSPPPKPQAIEEPNQTDACRNSFALPLETPSGRAPLATGKETINSEEGYADHAADETGRTESAKSHLIGAYAQLIAVDLNQRSVGLSFAVQERSP